MIDYYKDLMQISIVVCCEWVHFRPALFVLLNDTWRAINATRTFKTTSKALHKLYMYLYVYFM